MSRRVLVTRPQPGAAATAQALVEAGFEPIVLPLTEIHKVALGSDAPGRFDAVVATSANALRHAPAELLERLAGLSAFAVGEATAKAASAAGFRKVTVGPGNAAGLIPLISGSCPAGARVAYLCGRIRLPLLERQLAASGIEVVPIETYDTMAVTPTPEALRELAAGPPIFATLVYSSLGAQALVELMEQPPLAPVFAETVHICISREAAIRLAQGRTSVAAPPDEASMFAWLRRLN